MTRRGTTDAVIGELQTFEAEARTQAHPGRFRPIACLAGVIAAAAWLPAEENTVDEYQLVLSPQHGIAGRLSGFGELAYHGNDTNGSRSTVVGWPGLIYTTTTWLQFAGGLRSVYTENRSATDLLELRPFGGMKVQVRNRLKWHFYNYTRYEYRRIENLDTHASTEYGRIRSRFGLEIPLAGLAKAWKIKSWYGLADVEPYYRFDKQTLDPVLVRIGLGYVLSDRFHPELIYQAQFAHPAGGGSREVNSHVLQLHVKIGLQQGILREIRGMTLGR